MMACWGWSPWNSGSDRTQSWYQYVRGTEMVWTGVSQLVGGDPRVVHGGVLIGSQSWVLTKSVSLKPRALY